MTGVGDPTRASGVAGPDVGGFGGLLDLLDDLEYQAEALFHAERGHELADRSRAEYAQVTLPSRLMASVGAVVGVGVQGVGLVEGRLASVAADWCGVRGPGQDWVIRLDAVTTVRGASERSVPEVAWSPLARLGFTSALRRLADAGQRGVVRLRGGEAYDAVPHRVGADFVEVMSGERGDTLLVATAAIAAVQSRD